MYTSRLFALMAAVVFVVTLAVAAFIYGGTPLVLSVVIAGATALVGWMATAYRRPASRPAALDLYVAAVVALVVMYAEQWSGGFESRLRQLFPAAYANGVGVSDHAFVAVFPLGGTALLLLGALLYYHAAPFGRFAAWFTFAWAATSALGVYVDPLVAGRHAGILPGLVTAPLPLLIGVFGMRALVRREGVYNPARAFTVARTPTRARRTAP